MGYYNTKDVKCPHCEQMIDYLNEYSSMWCHNDIYLDKDGTVDYNNRDPIMDEMRDTDYECPECSEIITHHYDKAIEFLKGEWDGKKD